MGNSWTPYKTYQRLKSIVNDYQMQNKKLNAEIQKIQSDRRYTLDAKTEMINEIRTRLSAESTAAQLNLAQLRKDYAAELENYSPVSLIGEGDNKRLFVLSDNDIRVLKSLDYIPLTADTWRKLAENTDPETSPAMAAAIQKKAAENGYEFHGWYKTPAEKMKEFDKAAASVSTVINAYDNGREDAPWIVIDAENMIDNTIKSYDKFNDDGSRKAPEPIMVYKIPETPEEIIAADFDAQKAAEADATLEERVQIAQAFGDEESAKAEMMGEALSKVSQIKFERDYEATPAEVTAKEQTERITEGGAVE